MSSNCLKRITPFTVVFLLSFALQSQEIFTAVNPNPEMRRAEQNIVQRADYYDVNINALKTVLNSAQTVNLSIPVRGKTKSVHLQKVNILSPDYKLYTGSGKTFNTANRYTFYRGSVVGEKESKVAMTFYDDQLVLSIFDDDGNYEINKHDQGYAGYYNHDRIDGWDRSWACEVIEEEASKPKNKAGNSRTSDPDCITIFFEIDHKMYDKKGSDVANTEACVSQYSIKWQYFSWSTMFRSIYPASRYGM